MTYEGMISDLVKLREHSMMPAVFKPTLNAILEYFAYKDDIDGAQTIDIQQNWIPVSEKLPEKSGWYLITTYGYEHVVDMFWYYHESNQWNGLSNLEEVVAWMPLPAPYKEEREEYELAIEQMEYDAMYEPTYNSEDGSI